MDSDILFNFSLVHWQAFLLSFVPAMISLGYIVYYLKFPKYRIHRIYLLLLFSIFLWQIDESFSRISLSEETARAWDRLLIIGWIMLIPSNVQWAFLLTGRKIWSNNYGFIILLYFPAYLFGILLCSGAYSQSFIYKSYWGWARTYNNDGSFMTVPLIWWCTAAVFIFFLLTSFAYKNRFSADLKIGSALILIGYSFQAILGIAIQVFLPFFFKIDPIPISSALMLTNVFMIMGISASKQFNLSESLESERITEVIQEIIFLVSPQRAITYMNPYGASATGSAGVEKKYLKHLFLDLETCSAFENQVINPGFQNQNPSHLYFSKEDRSGQIHWDVSTYPICNNKSVSGLLVMCRDVSDKVLMGEAKLASLRSQMNPHFIFNSLNSIQHYIHSNQREQAENFLSTFAVLIRQILDNSAHSFIPLRDELQSIQLYLELEKARFGEKLSFLVNIDENIDTDVLLVPSMLIQPYIENAILHGLSSKKEEGILTIHIKRELNFIVCFIKDNGIGRKKAMEMNNRRKLKKTSYGLSITQARLDILNKKLNFPVEVKITDLYDERQQACGTLVEICIPVQERF